MKYLRYTLIILLKLLGKIIGVPIFYLVLPFRAYARNRVYNYVLQNDIYLPRLLERKWTLDKESGLYFPQNKSRKVFNLKNDAYVKYKKVSKLEYYFALMLWIWVDDDSNYDTHDGKPEEETSRKPFGNTFDLGDLRGDYPVVNSSKTFKWIVRNTFYNFNYMFEEIKENDKNFFYVKFSIFGFTTHWGFIPYENSRRQGRLIFGTEDIDKIDKIILN